MDPGQRAESADYRAARRNSSRAVWAGHWAAWARTYFSNLWICSSLYANSAGGGKSKHSIKSATDTRCTEVNIHTAGKSVFMIMLMDRCYLLQQHLHLLTARSGGQEVRGQASQSQDVSSDLNLGTFCHWPAPPPAWPALSAGAPAGSETPGCRRHKSASACGPEEMETGWNLDQQITSLTQD